MRYGLFIFGIAFGSFLNVCIHRIPRKMSIVSPRSICPNCGSSIKFYDNIPLISYLLLKGRCRSCKERISLRYPIVEIITGLLFVLLYERFGFSIEFFVLLLFISLLLIISFVDLELQIIPDILSIGGLFLGLGLSFFRNLFSFKSSILGIVIGGGILFAVAYLYELFTKREGMGGGDIKLLAMIGSFLGPKGVIFSLVVGSFFGTCFGIPLMIAKGKDSKYAIPFGPFLSLASLIYIFWGELLIYGFLRGILQ